MNPPPTCRAAFPTAATANHASMRARQLYARRRDEVSLDEVGSIVI
jgi:1,2-phenylacetyl-CoA epoxidase PaaB subunit